MKKKNIRVGLIGHKFMGVAHSNAYRNAGMWYDLPVTLEMKCVCADDTPENLREFADRYGWQEIEQNWKNLVARDDIDLLSVATPGFLHKEMVLEAAKNGKHILCEKPLANSLADSVEMLEAVEKANVRHCCGFSYRFTPATALAKQMIADGRIGEIRQVFVRYAQDWLFDEKAPMAWRLDKTLAGSGALGDICSHSIDLTRFMTGFEFVSLVSQLKTVVPKRPLRADDPEGPQGDVTVDDIVQMLCRFDSGAVGCFEATRMATGRKNFNSIEINGSKGSLFWNFEDQNYLEFFDATVSHSGKGFARINATADDHSYGGGPWPLGHGLGYGDTFVLEIANFARAIAEKTEFSPSFVDAVACQKVLDAIERSAENEKWINIT